MTEILLFHHALGLTDGVRSFAEELRAAGHIVHAPDLYEGRTFSTVEDGVAFAREVGFDVVIRRGEEAAADQPDQLVYGGFSLGAMPAQKLAQTRHGAQGALLFHAAIPPSEFGGPWPEGVGLQIHTMEDDELGDADVARQLVADIDGAELFLYPGDRHLFTDRTTPDYDEDAAKLVMERVLAFLEHIA